jgi:hypothetical protein
MVPTMISVASRTVALFVVVSSLACSPPGAPAVAPGQGTGRILIGRLVVDGAPASEWVDGGAYAGADLVVDDQVVVRDGRAILESTSSDAPRQPFTSVGARGGPIHFGVWDGPAYVLGLRVSRTLVALATTSVFPILVRVPDRVGSCDYIGTIHLHRDGSTTRATVVDDYDEDAAVLARGIGRCVPTKNLAQILDIVDGTAVVAGPASAYER